ncbi:NAD(P)-dependent oxidoreductase [Agaribacterium haliotis]|uniref:NAD(P)-dependent oxidoreductase n=1 Tax=Agaribacterium haliotis TaxID=2013869 RepID=UPI000BB57961|nr:NAD(P)-dependent oxidoreductase [Agaribacterium haliotis]
MTKLAFLGLGAMGSRMAQKLADAGHQLNLWQRSDKTVQISGAKLELAARPQAAANGASVVFSMLRDDNASHQTWNCPSEGALAAMQPGSIAVECSTLSPKRIEQLQQQCKQRGVLFVHAPVLGSRPQAEAGQLIVLAGGDAHALEQITPLLAQFSSAQHNCVTAANAAKLKLLANSCFAIQVLASAELLSLAKDSGLDPARALELLRATPLLSPAAAATGTAILNKKFAPMFAIELVNKDLDYARALAAQKTPLLEITREYFKQAAEQGMENLNINAVAKLFSIAEE